MSIKKLMNDIRKKTDSASFANSSYGTIKDWISTGDYALNGAISGNTSRGIPSGKIVILAGESQCLPSYQALKVYGKPLFDKEQFEEVCDQLIPELKGKQEAQDLEHGSTPGYDDYCANTKGHMLMTNVQMLTAFDFSEEEIIELSGLDAKVLTPEFAKDREKETPLQSHIGENITLEQSLKAMIMFECCIKEIPMEALKGNTKGLYVGSPDGIVPITDFFDKGEQEIWELEVSFNIQSENPDVPGQTITRRIECAKEHAVQIDDMTFVHVDKLEEFDTVLVEFEDQVIPGAVTKVASLDKTEQCYDIEVGHDNHRYFAGGIVSHNSGKSFIAANIAANALNENGYDMVFYFDSEGGGLTEFFTSRGCDPEKIEHILVEDVEDCTIKILSVYKKINDYKKENPDAKFLCILDSLGMLSASKLMADATEKGKQVQDMGSTARLKNNMIKGLIIPALKSDSSCIIVNHIYDDPGAMHKSKIKNQSGGKGLVYAAHLIIQCSKKTEKNDDVKTEGNHFNASLLRFFIVKNRVIKPFYQTEMFLDYAKGPMKYFGLVEDAKKYGLLVKDGHRYRIPSSEEPEKKRFLSSFINDEVIWEPILERINEEFAKDRSYSSGDSEEDLEKQIDAANDLAQLDDSGNIVVDSSLLIG